jgi:hypothetical protein
MEAAPNRVVLEEGDQSRQPRSGVRMQPTVRAVGTKREAGAPAGRKTVVAQTLQRPPKAWLSPVGEDVFRSPHRLPRATLLLNHPFSNPSGISPFRNGCDLAPTVADWRKTSTGGQYGALYATRIISKSRQETSNTANRKNNTQHTEHTTSKPKEIERQTEEGRARQLVNCDIAIRSVPA